MAAVTMLGCVFFELGRDLCALTLAVHVHAARIDRISRQAREDARWKQFLIRLSEWMPVILEAIREAARRVRRAVEEIDNAR
jgi:transposase